jgi:hypothetical protein
MARRAHILDTVRLTREIDGWPAGTIGAVVSERPESALVEVVSDATVDAIGLPRTDLLDDMVSVPYAALDIVRPAPAVAR